MENDRSLGMRAQSGFRVVEEHKALADIGKKVVGWGENNVKMKRKIKMCNL